MTATIYKNTREQLKFIWIKSVFIVKLVITKHMSFLNLNLPRKYFLSLLENTFEILSLILVKIVNSGRLYPYVLVR